MTNRYVLDACALIAFYNEEKGDDIVDGILIEAAQGKSAVFIHKLNLFEVYYDLVRTNGEGRANEALVELNKSKVFITNRISDDLMKTAAHFKVSHKMSIADSFALALAKVENATLITADHHELDAVKTANEVSIKWIR